MKIHQLFCLGLVFLGVSHLTGCATTGPLVLPPDYIAKHTTKETPVAPSSSLSSNNSSVVQSGI